MTSIAEELQEVRSTKSGIAGAIKEMGVEVPTNTPFRRYPELIGEIVTTPTLKGLKRALKNGDAAEKFPLNSEIGDVWNNEENPWIIAHYGTATLVSGENISGAYLFRKFVTSPNQQVWNSAQESSVYYGASSLNGYLRNEYISGCSDELKDIATEIVVPFHISDTQTGSANAMFFAPSVTEIYGTRGGFHDEGSYWEAFKIRTGWDNPSDNNTGGRTIGTNSGGAYDWWTRTKLGGLTAEYVNSNGGIGDGRVNLKKAVIVACFIGGN